MGTDILEPRGSYMLEPNLTPNVSEAEIDNIIPLEITPKRPFWDEKLWEILKGDEYAIFVLAMKAYGILIRTDAQYIIEKKKDKKRVIAVVGQNALWEMGIFDGVTVYRRE